MKQSEHVAYEMFGVRIYFVEGMVRLKDIQRAYCAESGESEESTRPGEWRKVQDAERLIEFLENLKMDEPSLKAIEYPRGKKGGMYVCRELAHHYAMWLDVRYAYHVLKAFDELASGDLFGAKKTANKVVKRITQEPYKARFERFAALGVDYKKYMRVVLMDVMNVVEDVDDLTRFLETVTTKCPTSAMLINEVIAGAEIACVNGGDIDDCLKDAMDLYVNDPRLDTLNEFIKRFNEGAL